MSKNGCFSFLLFMYVSYFCNIYALYWTALKIRSNNGLSLFSGGDLFTYNFLPFGNKRRVFKDEPLFSLLLKFKSIFFKEFGEGLFKLTSPTLDALVLLVVLVALVVLLYVLLTCVVLVPLINELLYVVLILVELLVLLLST